MAAEPLLQVRDVARRFGGIVALDGVSLDVPAGIVFGLIGPNGSGKTTLLNIITGFVRADRGTVSFDGRPIRGLPSYRIARLGLSRTFQSSRCPQRMTVMENMLLAAANQSGESLGAAILQFRRVRAEERANLERAREILATVNLAAKVDELAGNLSGGQKKLLSLAQALMSEPKLILLDEPVAGVNPILVQEIGSVIRSLCDAGRNFLIVEHNMSFIRATCDRVAVLDTGRLIAEGEPDEVLARENVLRAYLARPTAEAPA
ncbi:MAG: ABC transporter ATP-binding protein [Bauldia sp.]|nr:ABC transporter ATP-binding protein [Bauldia sp.]